MHTCVNKNHLKLSQIQYIQNLGWGQSRLVTVSFRPTVIDHTNTYTSYKCAFMYMCNYTTIFSWQIQKHIPLYIDICKGQNRAMESKWYDILSIWIYFVPKFWTVHTIFCYVWIPVYLKNFTPTYCTSKIKKQECR